MSRQNKVNPGTYTQRGRLTQDDAARELRKQSVIGSPHTWQPVNTRRTPWPAPAATAARDTDAAADNEAMVETPVKKTRQASRVTRKTTASKASPSMAKAKAAKSKMAGTRKSKGTSVKAKTSATRTTVRKRAAKPTRKAVVARKAGGRAAPRRTTTTRRRSS